MRCRVIHRFAGERRWQQLDQHLLQIGSEQRRPVPAADEPAAAIDASLEVPQRRRHLGARLRVQDYGRLDA